MIRVQDARYQQPAAKYQNTVLKAALETEDALLAFLRSQEKGSMYQTVETLHQRRKVVMVTGGSIGFCQDYFFFGDVEWVS